MPAQLHRAPPYLFWGLALSLLFHGGLALLGYLPALALRLLPRLPIEMTILPPKPRAQPAPPAAVVPPPSPPAGEPKPGEGDSKPAPRKPAPKKPPTPQVVPPKIAPLSGLGPSAIDRDIGVRVVLRMTQLRSSPHRPALARLLAAFPDTHLLAHGTSLPSTEALAQLLISELQAVLIATPDPSDLTATAFYGVAADTSRVQAALAGRKQLPWDPRELSVPRRGLLALARPDLLGPGTYAAAAPPGAPPGAPPPPAVPPNPAATPWPEQLRTALLAAGPALSAEILNVNARVRLQGGLPTPTALRLAMSGEERPAVTLRLELRTPEEATRLAAVLPELKTKMATYLFLLGLSGFFDELQLAVHGSQVELGGHVPARQLDILLDLLAHQLPPPSRFLPPPPPPPEPPAAASSSDAGASPDAGRVGP